MSALRYSGRVRVRLTYRNPRPSEVYADGSHRFPNGSYACTLQATDADGKIEARTRIVVGAPAFLSEAVDSVEAFDAAARAALAFADAEASEARRAWRDAFAWGEAAAYAHASAAHTWHVGRKPSEAFPPPATREVSILAIDAWRDGEGWTWNAWRKIGSCDVAIASLPPRRLLAFLRSEGYLTPRSTGRVRVVDDQYNMTVCDKGTGEPLIAIAYGEADVPDSEASAENPSPVNDPEAARYMRERYDNGNDPEVQS